MYHQYRISSHTSVFMGLTEFNSLKEAYSAVTSRSIEIVIKTNGGCRSWVVEFRATITKHLKEAV